MAFAGFAIFVVLDFIAVFATLGMANSGQSNEDLVIGIGAALLAGIALGGGGFLVALRKPWAKGLGLGLMIGWALVSIVSVGFCTGINPSIYTDGYQ